MSDPRMIPADEAKNIQTMFSPFGDLSNRGRKIRDLAATVVAQAAQIKRLQAALRTASDLNTLMERGYLTAEDMEDTDD